VVAQHHAIYAAIKAADPAAAEDAVGRHVDALERMYRRAGLLRAESDSTRVAP